MVPPVQPVAVPSTVESSAPIPSLPAHDPEQMVPMHLARPSIANIIPDRLPQGTEQITNDPPPSRAREAVLPVVTKTTRAPLVPLWTEVMY